MLQATLLDCQFLDLIPFPDDGFVAPEVDVSWCDVVQAFVVSLVVVVIDEGPDLALEITGQIVVLQQNPVLHGLMPAFNFELMRWMPPPSGIDCAKVVSYEPKRGRHPCQRLAYWRLILPRTVFRFVASGRAVLFFLTDRYRDRDFTSCWQSRTAASWRWKRAPRPITGDVAPSHTV